MVTGGTGFIATHCLARLLQDGYRVRTTLRSVFRRPDVLEMLSAAGVDEFGRLDVAQADLLDDAGWAEAVADCQGVLHLASPFPAGDPRDPDELIVPARDGTLRVLRAAHAAGVERVVVTSSFAAIGSGHPADKTEFTEDDWSLVDGDLSPYALSKTLAEQAAWDFASESGLEVSVVNPVLVTGEVLGPDYSTSISLVQRLIDGQLPGLPNVTFGLVDVHDVADLHLLALTCPEAAGERFIAVAEDFWTLRRIARCLREGLTGSAGSKVPKLPVPDSAARLAGVFDPAIRSQTRELGRVKNANSAKARELLGWEPLYDNEATLLATAESLIELRKELDEPTI